MNKDKAWFFEKKNHSYNRQSCSKIDGEKEKTKMTHNTERR